MALRAHLMDINAPLWPSNYNSKECLMVSLLYGHNSQSHWLPHYEFFCLILLLNTQRHTIFGALLLFFWLLDLLLSQRFWDSLFLFLNQGLSYRRLLGSSHTAVLPSLSCKQPPSLPTLPVTVTLTFIPLMFHTSYCILLDLSSHKMS